MEPFISLKVSSQEILFFNVAGIAVFISVWFYAISWLNNKLTLLKKLGSICLLVSLISLTIGLIYRGIALQFFPLTNLYESLVIFAWAVIFAYLILEWKFKIDSFGSIYNRATSSSHSRMFKLMIGTFLLVPKISRRTFGTFLFNS